MTTLTIQPAPELCSSSELNSRALDWRRSSIEDGTQFVIANSLPVRTGTTGATIVFVDVKPWPQTHQRAHNSFDEFLNELDNSPEQAAVARDARKWVSEAFYKDRPTLSSLRLASGLSQKELADACGIAQPHISRYEAGKHAPNIDSAEAMARALNVDLNSFYAAWRNTANNAQVDPNIQEEKIIKITQSIREA